MDCNWNNPGNLPARNNDVAAMVSSYNYPQSDVAVLVEKIRTANNDGVVVITKNGLIGLSGYASGFEDMHFKNGKCRGPVDTSNWPIDRQEKALVYCSNNNNCVAIPTICGNVTKIVWQRKEKQEPSIKAKEDWNDIPEPSTMLLVAIAIAALFKFMPR